MRSLKPLQQLGDLHSGYQYRSRTTLEQGQGKAYGFLQLRDIEAGDRINWDKLDQINFEDNPQSYILKHRDVLFPLKGGKLKAILVEQPPMQVIAAGHWAIITPKSELIDSEYLVWYLNHPHTVQQMEKLLRGSNIQFISMGDLRNFSIHVPSLERQKQIVTVARLRQRERDLVTQLELVRDQLIDAKTMRAATNNR